MAAQAAQTPLDRNIEAQELRSALHRLGIPPIYPQVPLFRRFASPVGGVGLKAIKNIPRGTPILSERELFWVIEGTNLIAAQWNDPGFQALSCPHPATVQRRFDVNSFHMGNQGRNQKHGIFLQASRFNHSCVPNAHFAWHWRLRRLTVHAMVDIPNGEEIFINYSTDDYLKTRIQRQQGLNHYGFQCTCPACQQNSDFGRASEARRREMRVLDRRITGNQDPVLPDLRNQLLNDIIALGLLLRDEGLFYPQLSDLFSQQILWYEREAQHISNGHGSARCQAELPGAALQVARAKLDLDVACTGHTSPVVARTLWLVRDRVKQ